MYSAEDGLTSDANDGSQEGEKLLYILMPKGLYISIPRKPLLSKDLLKIGGCTTGSF